MDFYFDKIIPLKGMDRQTFGCSGKGGIYFHFGNDNTLLYIGVAENLSRRLDQELFAYESHLRKVVHNFAVTKIMYVPDKNERFILEKHFIKRFRPLFNIQHNDYQEVYERYNEKYIKKDMFDLILEENEINFQKRFDESMENFSL